MLPTKIPVSYRGQLLPQSGLRSALTLARSLPAASHAALLTSRLPSRAIAGPPPFSSTRDFSTAQQVAASQEPAAGSDSRALSQRQDAVTKTFEEAGDKKVDAHSRPRKNGDTTKASEGRRTEPARPARTQSAPPMKGSSANDFPNAPKEQQASLDTVSTVLETLKRLQELVLTKEGVVVKTRSVQMLRQPGVFDRFHRLLTESHSVLSAHSPQNRQQQQQQRPPSKTTTTTMESELQWVHATCVATRLSFILSQVFSNPPSFVSAGALENGLSSSAMTMSMAGDLASSTASEQALEQAAMARSLLTGHLMLLAEAVDPSPPPSRKQGQSASSSSSAISAGPGSQSFSYRIFYKAAVEALREKPSSNDSPMTELASSSGTDTNANAGPAVSSSSSAKPTSAAAPSLSKGSVIASLLLLPQNFSLLTELLGQQPLSMTMATMVTTATTATSSSSSSSSHDQQLQLIDEAITAANDAADRFTETARMQVSNAPTTTATTNNSAAAASSAPGLTAGAMGAELSGTVKEPALRKKAGNSSSDDQHHHQQQQASFLSRVMIGLSREIGRHAHFAAAEHAKRTREALLAAHLHNQQLQTAIRSGGTGGSGGGGAGDLESSTDAAGIAASSSSSSFSSLSDRDVLMAAGAIATLPNAGYGLMLPPSNPLLACMPLVELSQLMRALSLHHSAFSSVAASGTADNALRLTLDRIGSQIPKLNERIASETERRVKLFVSLSEAKEAKKQEGSANNSADSNNSSGGGGGGGGGAASALTAKAKVKARKEIADINQEVWKLRLQLNRLRAQQAALLKVEDLAAARLAKLSAAMNACSDQLTIALHTRLQAAMADPATVEALSSLFLVELSSPSSSSSSAAANVETKDSHIAAEVEKPAEAPSVAAALPPLSSCFPACPLPTLGRRFFSTSSAARSSSMPAATSVAINSSDQHASTRKNNGNNGHNSNNKNAKVKDNRSRGGPRPQVEMQTAPAPQPVVAAPAAPAAAAAAAAPAPSAVAAPSSAVAAAVPVSPLGIPVPPSPLHLTMLGGFGHFSNPSPFHSAQPPLAGAPAPSSLPAIGSALPPGTDASLAAAYFQAKLRAQVAAAEAENYRELLAFMQAQKTASPTPIPTPAVLEPAAAAGAAPASVPVAFPVASAAPVAPVQAAALPEQQSTSTPAAVSPSEKALRQEQRRKDKLKNRQERQGAALRPSSASEEAVAATLKAPLPVSPSTEVVVVEGKDPELEASAEALAAAVPVPGLPALDSDFSAPTAPLSSLSLPPRSLEEQQSDVAALEQALMRDASSSTTVAATSAASSVEIRSAVASEQSILALKAELDAEVVDEAAEEDAATRAMTAEASSLVGISRSEGRMAGSVPASSKKAEDQAAAAAELSSSLAASAPSSASASAVPLVSPAPLPWWYLTRSEQMGIATALQALAALPISASAASTAAASTHPHIAAVLEIASSSSSSSSSTHGPRGSKHLPSWPLADDVPAKAVGPALLAARLWGLQALHLSRVASASAAAGGGSAAATTVDNATSSLAKTAPFASLSSQASQSMALAERTAEMVKDRRATAPLPVEALAANGLKPLALISEALADASCPAPPYFLQSIAELLSSQQLVSTSSPAASLGRELQHIVEACEMLVLDAAGQRGKREQAIEVAVAHSDAKPAADHSSLPLLQQSPKDLLIQLRPDLPSGSASSPSFSSIETAFKRSAAHSAAFQALHPADRKALVLRCLRVAPSASFPSNSSISAAADLVAGVTFLPSPSSPASLFSLYEQDLRLNRKRSFPAAPSSSSSSGEASGHFIALDFGCKRIGMTLFRRESSFAATDSSRNGSRTRIMRALSEPATSRGRPVALTERALASHLGSATMPPANVPLPRGIVKPIGAFNGPAAAAASEAALSQLASYPSLAHSALRFLELSCVSHPGGFFQTPAASDSKKSSSSSGSASAMTAGSMLAKAAMNYRQLVVLGEQAATSSSSSASSSSSQPASSPPVVGSPSFTTTVGIAARTPGSATATATATAATEPAGTATATAKRLSSVVDVAAEQYGLLREQGVADKALTADAAIKIAMALTLHLGGLLQPLNSARKAIEETAALLEKAKQQVLRSNKMAAHLSSADPSAATSGSSFLSAASAADGSSSVTTPATTPSKLPRVATEAGANHLEAGSFAAISRGKASGSASLYSRGFLGSRQHMEEQQHGSSSTAAVDRDSRLPAAAAPLTTAQITRLQDRLRKQTEALQIISSRVRVALPTGRCVTLIEALARISAFPLQASLSPAVDGAAASRLQSRQQELREALAALMEEGLLPFVGELQTGRERFMNKERTAVLSQRDQNQQSEVLSPVWLQLASDNLHTFASVLAACEHLIGLNEKTSQSLKAFKAQASAFALKAISLYHTTPVSEADERKPFDQSISLPSSAARIPGVPSSTCLAESHTLATRQMLNALLTPSSDSGSETADGSISSVSPLLVALHRTAIAKSAQFWAPDFAPLPIPMLAGDNGVPADASEETKLKAGLGSSVLLSRHTLAPVHSFSHAFSHPAFFDSHQRAPPAPSAQNSAASASDNGKEKSAVSSLLANLRPGTATLLLRDACPELRFRNPSTRSFLAPASLTSVNATMNAAAATRYQKQLHLDPATDDFARLGPALCPPFPMSVLADLADSLLLSSTDTSRLAIVLSRHALQVFGAGSAVRKLLIKPDHAIRFLGAVAEPLQKHALAGSNPAIAQPEDEEDGDGPSEEDEQEGRGGASTGTLQQEWASATDPANADANPSAQLFRVVGKYFRSLLRVKRSSTASATPPAGHHQNLSPATYLDLFDACLKGRRVMRRTLSAVCDHLAGEHHVPSATAAEASSGAFLSGSFGADRRHERSAALADWVAWAGSEAESDYGDSGSGASSADELDALSLALQQEQQQRQKGSARAVKRSAGESAGVASGVSANSELVAPNARVYARAKGLSDFSASQLLALRQSMSELGVSHPPLTALIEKELKAKNASGGGGGRSDAVWPNLTASLQAAPRRASAAKRADGRGSAPSLSWAEKMATRKRTPSPVEKRGGRDSERQRELPRVPPANSGGSFSDGGSITDQFPQGLMEGAGAFAGNKNTSGGGGGSRQLR